MGATTPTVLISSTCYDLSQVRADLVDFIEKQLGFHPLASEYNSFPIDPDVTTIENCKNRVEHQADCLILIIGGRYGSIDLPTGRSITNLEYLAARAKGIPTYVFLEKSVSALYSLWQMHPGNNFDGSVDNPKIFEFIREVKDVQKIWTISFNRAEDIIDALRNQFAFLLFTLLAQRRRFQASVSDVNLEGLGGAAFRLALERPSSWEYRLFSELLTEELKRHARLRRDYAQQFTLGSGPTVKAFNDDWIPVRIGEIADLGKQVGVLINKGLPEAFGPAGKPGNIESIRYVASRIGEVYRFALEWTQSVRRAVFEPVLSDVKDAMCDFSKDLIEKIEHMDKAMREVLSDFDGKVARGEKMELNLMLKIESTGLDRFNAALKIAAEKITGRAPNW